MTKTRSRSYTTIIVLVIIGILLLSPSVFSQTINTTLLMNNTSIIGYLSIGFVCFLLGLSSKFTSTKKIK